MKSQENAAVVLLSGGNPQVAKGEGDAVVERYLAAMPGWKQDVGRRIDSAIARAVPGVRKAVKWNTPLYGDPDGAAQTWFLGFHCVTKYVKVSFFRGAALDPVPPVASKQAEVRYFHLHGDDAFDEALFESWVRQARALPGVKM